MTARRKRLCLEARLESQGMQVLSLYLLYWYKSTHTKVPVPRGTLGIAAHAGPQFTCFTGTKVHILTLRAASYHRQGVQERR